MRAPITWQFYDVNTTIYGPDEFAPCRAIIPANTLVGCLGRFGILIYNAHRTGNVKLARITINDSHVVANCYIPVSGIDLEGDMEKVQSEAAAVLYDFMFLLRKNLLLLRKKLQDENPTQDFVDRYGSPFTLFVRHGDDYQNEIGLVLQYTTARFSKSLGNVKSLCTYLIKSIRMAERFGTYSRSFFV